MGKDENSVQLNDLLIADLQHFGESLWRNEEVGEKRFSFFVTLITAVIGALVALTTSDYKPSHEIMRNLEGAVLLALFVFGLLTYLRMLQRNHVTDEYQHTLNYIRKRFVSLCPELALYKVPKRHKTWWSKWLKGGYAETIGTINSILLGAIMFRYYRADIALVITVSFTFLALQWVRASMRRKGDSEEENNETT